MQRTERRLDVAALVRNSKHQPNRVAVISEAHSFELTFPAPAVELRGAGTSSFTCAVSADGAERPTSLHCRAKI